DAVAPGIVRPFPDRQVAAELLDEGPAAIALQMATSNRIMKLQAAEHLHGEHRTTGLEERLLRVVRVLLSQLPLREILLLLFVPRLIPPVRPPRMEHAAEPVGPGRRPDPQGVEQVALALGGGQSDDPPADGGDRLQRGPPP